MKKASNFFAYIITILFTGICGYIGFHTLDYFERLKYLNTILGTWGKAVLMLSGICFVAALCLLFLWLECFLDQRISESKKRVLEIFFAVGSMGILILGQLVLIKGIGQSTFMFDSGRLYDEVIHMLTSHTVDGSGMDGYLGMYPNNIPATILFYWLASAGASFGLAETQLMVLLQVGNAFCIDIAILLTFFLLRSYVGRKCSHVFLLVCLLNPMIYIWGGFVYTTTYCMPFLMGGMLLFLSLIEEKRRGWQIGKGIFLGVLLAAGFRLRATLIITFIACTLYLFLKLPFLRGDFRQDQKAFRVGLRNGRGCLASFLSFLICLSVLQGIEASYVKFDTKDTAFPVISWLAMGLEGNGGFNGTDFRDTKNASTAEEKKRINEEKFRQRLEKLGVEGCLSLAGLKMNCMWVDGTDTYETNLDQYTSHNGLHTYLFEEDADFMVLFMQMMRAFSFFFAFLGALTWLIQRRGGESFLEPVHLLQLNFLGGIFFHVFWESGELYSLSFTLLLFALAAVGLVECKKMADVLSGASVARKYIFLGGPIALIALCVTVIAGMNCYKAAFTELPVRRESFAIRQLTYSSEEPENLTEGNSLTQTFVTNQPFNRLAIRVSNQAGKEPDAEYEILLQDKTGRVLLNTRIEGKDLYHMDYVYCALEGLEEPIVYNSYSFTITCLHGDKEGSIGFLRYDTGNHDAYLGGALSVNGTVLEKADLNFFVSHRYEGAFMEAADYQILCLSVLLGMLFVIVGSTAIYFYGIRKEKPSV